MYNDLKGIADDVLSLRNDTSNDRNTIPLLERAIQTGQKLINERDELSKFLNVDFTLQAEEISNYAKIIESAGLFSIFFRDYRDAKRLYKKLSKSDKFKRDFAVDTGQGKDKKRD